MSVSIEVYLCSCRKNFICITWVKCPSEKTSSVSHKSAMLAKALSLPLSAFVACIEEMLNIELDRSLFFSRH
jgi:hypothetical protein